MCWGRALRDQPSPRGGCSIPGSCQESPLVLQGGAEWVPDAAQAVHLARAGLLTAVLRSRGCRPDQAHERAFGENRPGSRTLPGSCPPATGQLALRQRVGRALNAGQYAGSRRQRAVVVWTTLLPPPPARRHAPTSRCRRYVNCWTYLGLWPGAKKAASRHRSTQVGSEGGSAALHC